MKFTYIDNVDYSVKSLSQTHACMKVVSRLYDTPHNEDEVGRKLHENPNCGRIVGVQSTEQSV